MLGGFDPVLGQRLARCHRRQTAGLVVLFVVATFLIKLQKTVEADHLTGGPQIKLALVRDGGNIDARAFEVGRFHLARDHASRSTHRAVLRRG